MRNVLAALVMTVGLSAPTMAQESEPLPVSVRPLPPPTAEELACAEDGGIVVNDFSQLAQLPLGQCVTVSGLHDGFTLAADLPSLYARDTADDPERGGLRIGLMGVPLQYQDSGVRVTALLLDCADRRPVEGDVPDYCWTRRGRYLAAVRWRLDSQQPFQRLSLANRPATLGNLALMAEGDASTRLRAAAAPLWSAIAANDAPRLMAMLESSDHIGAAVLVSSAQPASERWVMGQPQTIVLGWLMPDNATAAQREELAARADIEGVVCAADAATAAASAWPIDTRDTAVHRERSYVCAHIWLPANGPANITMRSAEMILPEPGR
jgi:hypothetical protein